MYWSVYVHQDRVVKDECFRRHPDRTIAVEVCHEKRTKAEDARYLRIDDAEVRTGQVELCWEQPLSVT
jgi:hypothetical protein